MLDATGIQRHHVWSDCHPTMQEESYNLACITISKYARKNMDWLRIDGSLRIFFINLHNIIHYVLDGSCSRQTQSAA